MRSTSPRLFTWTALLYAALAMPLLQQMLPPLPIPTPALLEHELQNARAVFTGTAEQAPPLLAAERRRNTAHGASRGKDVNVVQPQRGERRTLTAQKPVSADVPTSSFSWTRESIRWNAIAATTYLAVAILLFVRFLIGLAFSRRLLRASQRINDPRITRPLAARAAAWGLASIPHAAESELISVPLTMGVFRPAILLPTAWRNWDDVQLNAVIAHEVSHIARRDALTLHLSLLHRAIFWFSPLSWWLDNHLAALSEQASDEAALSCGTDRKHYARILLGFFEALNTAPGRVWWQGVSMAKAGQAEHRVERILTWKGSVAMSLKKSIAVMIIALAVPVVYLAASAHPAQHVSLPGGARFAQDQPPQTPPPPTSSAAPSPTSETTPSPEPSPASGVAGGITDGTAGAADSRGPTPPPEPPTPARGVGTTVRAHIAPVAPTGPSAPVAVIAPIAPVAEIGQSESVGSSSGRRFSYHYGFDDEQRFVIVSGKTDSFTMSGSSEDARHVEKLRKNIQGDFIWFERDEKSYVIRDQATVDRAKKLWEPQEELGKKQEALGKQQEALGKQQAELGAKMQQIRVNVPDLNADLEKLKAELKQLGSSGATVEQVGHIQSEIGELQSKIGNVQSHAGDQQGKLGEEMGALGEKQGKLGQQQGELGRQQGELAEQATRQMKQLLDEAITKGLAQPEI